MITRRPVMFLIAAFLVNCSPAPVSPPPSKAWLTGAWVHVGTPCDSDAGVVFRSDGTWAAYESAGTWTLVGSTLVAVTTHRSLSGEESAEALAHPERHDKRIEPIGPDRYRSYRSSGDPVEMRRCPTGTR